jgi:hypothetical protein
MFYLIHIGVREGSFFVTNEWRVYMARKLRFVPPGGSMVEVMTRTIQRRFLMSPTPEVAEVILGIIGRAQARYQVTIYSFIFLSDHYHMQLRVKDARQLARFMRYINSNIAREVGKIVGWKGRFWEKRYSSVVVSEEEATQIERLKYIFSNGCKEGLVGSPSDWTGANTARALIRGEWVLNGRWFDRTKQYRASLRGKTGVFDSAVTVHISPLPCWNRLSGEEIKMRIADLVGEIEDEARHMHQMKGTTPMGMERVLQLHPHDAPQQEQSKRSHAPLFFATTREARQLFRQSYTSFLNRYRQAAERLRAGDLNVAFPPGSFPPPRPFVEALTPS